MKVVIIGGGIAGLTTAVALCRRGHDVEVLERRAEWPAVGWGLSRTGPALRALRTLGLNERCAAAGFAISGINNCDVRGTCSTAQIVVDAAQVMVDLESEHQDAKEHEVQSRALAALAAEAGTSSRRGA